jgi:hypothetical protein
METKRYYLDYHEENDEYDEISYGITKHIEFDTIDDFVNTIIAIKSEFKKPHIENIISDYGIVIDKNEEKIIDDAFKIGEFRYETQLKEIKNKKINDKLVHQTKEEIRNYLNENNQNKTELMMKHFYKLSRDQQIQILKNVGLISDLISNEEINNTYISFITIFETITDISIFAKLWDEINKVNNISKSKNPYIIE